MNFRSARVLFASLMLPLVLAVSTPATAGAATTTTYAPSTTVPAGAHVLDPNNPNPPAVNIPVGGGISFLIPSLQPGSVATITIDGVTITATVDAAGNLAVSVGILDPHVSINGSAPIPAHYGDNMMPIKVTLASGGTTVINQDVIIPAPGSNSGSDGLAFTGADIAAMTVVALALVGAGGALVLVARRRRSATR